ALMAATQRPVTGRALSDMATAPTWKQLPSYVIYGTADRNIPAEAERFMAERAQARKTVAVEGGSHALMVSHPDKIVALIEEAASAR
ncbi:MAG TPA: alpha/beta hydrolase, partial [Caulobacter sp.]|nr:alpha/beta hydrolase [Caulobacter sp.]